MRAAGEGKLSRDCTSTDHHDEIGFSRGRTITFEEAAIFEADICLAFGECPKGQDFDSWRARRTAPPPVFRAQVLEQAVVQRSGEQPLETGGGIRFDGELKFLASRNRDRLL